MKATIPDSALNDAGVRRADELLRGCVHCGFCNTACPTYLELGDENNGPRGRIYQMKTFLEGGTTSAANLKNLDQCLTCQACEVACPSGVQYTQLLDIMRPKVAAHVRRPLAQRLKRRAALQLLLRPTLLRLLLQLARPFRALLPKKYHPYFPSDTARQTAKAAPTTAAQKRIVLYDGCVQSAIAPNINASAKAVCAGVGIAASEEKGFCCGALQLHLEEEHAAMMRIRANVDILHNALQNGAEHIVSTASGCGRMVADYGRLLADDAQYADRARAVSAAHMDIAALLAAQEDLSGLSVANGTTETMAYHCPCTLQNAQRQGDTVPALFSRLGATLRLPADNKCCGSAGFYSQEHPQLARQLRDARLAQFFEHQPTQLLTSNIGCQLHLAGGSPAPVSHWIEHVRVAPPPSHLPQSR